MAIQTGTSTDWKDLLADLKTFAEANSWITESYTTDIDDEDPDTWYARGPGPTGTEDVHVNIRTGAITAENKYWWETRGAILYDSGLSFANQPGTNSTGTFTLLWNSSIDYWFYINDRRIIVIAKVSTTYRSLYAGFFLPPATPAEYPYPLYIASDYKDPDIYTLSLSGVRAFTDPGQQAAYLRKPDGSWAMVANHDVNSGADDFFENLATGPGITGFYVFPYFSGNTSTTTKDQIRNWKLRPVENEAGTQFITPLSFQTSHKELGNIGVIEGAYYINGFGNSAEQTFTYGGDTYRIFPNIDRNNENHFFCIREV